MVPFDSFVPFTKVVIWENFHKEYAILWSVKEIVVQEEKTSKASTPKKDHEGNTFEQSKLVKPGHNRLHKNQYMNINYKFTNEWCHQPNASNQLIKLRK